MYSYYSDMMIRGENKSYYMWRYTIKKFYFFVGVVEVNTYSKVLLACSIFSRFIAALYTIPGCTGDEIGSLEHYLLTCPALSVARSHALSLTKKVSMEHEKLTNILQSSFINQTPETMVQFLLDCSSLPDVVLLGQSPHSFLVDRVFYICRSWCYTIHRARVNKLGLFQFR